jgi:hypothetical protein
MMGLFGPEKIILTLEKNNYKPGEIIKGTVTLQLKKPTMARKLEIILEGMAYYTPIRRTHRGGSHHTSEDFSPEVFYSSSVTLDGEKEYLNGTYTFEYHIPPEILNPDFPKQMELREEDSNGRLANFIKNAAQVMQQVEQNRPIQEIDWEVKANLDIPKRLDVHASQSIALTP